MNPIKTLVKNTVRSLGYEIRPLPQKPSGPLQLWDADLQFNTLYTQIQDHTLASKQRCYLLHHLAAYVSCLEGQAAEIGVYKGGTARLIAKTLEPKNKEIHLFDTFTGMPETNPQKDSYRAGAFSDTSLESVKNYLADCQNIFLYPGMFPETAGPIEDRQFCFVHIDVDIYDSVKNCCEFYFPRLVGGGLLVFDDYGDRSCPGAKAAIDEFFSTTLEKPIYLPTGQCIIYKLQK